MLGSNLLADRKLNILLIDDDINVANVYSDMLKTNANFKVKILNSFKEFVDETMANVYDVIITDIYLNSNYTGLDVAEIIFNSKITTQVILITGQPDDKTINESLRLGVFDYIVKPICYAAIVRSVIRAAEKKILLDKIKLLEVEINYVNYNVSILENYLNIIENNFVEAKKSFKGLIDYLGIKEGNISKIEEGENKTDERQ